MIILNALISGPYYPLRTVPRAYDIFRPKKEWKGENIKLKKWKKIGKFNTKDNLQIQKYIL
jgi:hypothetical protein